MLGDANKAIRIPSAPELLARCHHELAICIDLSVDCVLRRALHLESQPHRRLRNSVLVRSPAVDRRTADTVYVQWSPVRGLPAV